MSGRGSRMIAMVLEAKSKELKSELNVNNLKVNVPYDILLESTDNDNYNILMPNKINHSQQDHHFQKECEIPQHKKILDPNEYYKQIDEIHDYYDNAHDIPIEIEVVSEITTEDNNEKVSIATTPYVPNDSLFQQIESDINIVNNNLDYITTEVEDFQEISDPKENSENIILQNTAVHNFLLEKNDNSNNDPDYILIEQNAIDSSNEERPEETENAPDKNENKRNKRKKMADPETWEKNVNKKKRMLGKDYVGYTRTKDGVVKHDMKRSERIMGPACISTFCKRATNRFCHLFSDGMRQNIFDKFWAMNWEQKKLYVLHMTSYHAPKRCYTKNPSRKTGSSTIF